MANSLRMIVNNAHDGALLSATTNALPIAYTQQSKRVKPWRSDGTGEQVIEGTLPAPTLLSGGILYRNNLSAGSRVRLEILNGTATAWDSGLRSVSGVIPLGEFRFGIDKWGATSTDDLPVKESRFWFPSTLATGYRWTITDADNPDGYIEIGRIVMGPVISPKFNPSFGLSLEAEDFSQHRRTEGLSLYTIGDGEARRLEFDLDHLIATDRQNLTRAFRRAGKRTDIYVSVFPEAGGFDEAEYAFLGRRENNWKHTHNRPKNWQSKIVIIEV
jgi:hypothetical protein